jgi:hypothetical protein
MELHFEPRTAAQPLLLSIHTKHYKLLPISCFGFCPERLQGYGAESVEIPHFCWEVVVVTNAASVDQIVYPILNCFSEK